MRYFTYIIKQADKCLVFILFSSVLIVNALILNKVIISDTIYFNTYSDLLEPGRISELINNRSKYEWIGYLLIPALLLVKLFFITLSIEIGLILKEYKLSVKQIFHVVLMAESVFIIGQMIRIITLFLFDLNTLVDIYNYYPLSILNLVNTGSIDTWLIYPLKLANVFTITYFFVLAYGLSLVLKSRPVRMLYFSISTYGLCLLIWIMLIMFLNVYFS
ncbi:MAG: hypothetical protein JSV22_01865 [Bacteroidales bacterium]|nr:MAG: hypothetical protein JSV22_01865 [Bacteroidales bacterium]